MVGLHQSGKPVVFPGFKQVLHSPAPLHRNRDVGNGAEVPCSAARVAHGVKAQSIAPGGGSLVVEKPARARQGNRIIERPLLSAPYFYIVMQLEVQFHRDILRQTINEFRAQLFRGKCPVVSP